MHRILSALAIIALFALHGLPAVAVMPDEVLSDPALEARAREISKELRCLVCQNQSIDDSNADLARDLRIIVRQRLTEGDSNNQVMQYVVDRYGDYVLLNPPVKGITYALWFGPPAILLLGGGALFLAARRRRTGAPVEALSAEERERLAKLLDGDSA